jgi:hypothetical protein
LKTDTDSATENRPVVVLEKTETGKKEDSVALQEQTTPGSNKKESDADKTETLSDVPEKKDKKLPADGENVLTVPEKGMPAQDGARITEDRPTQSGVASQSKIVQKPIQKPLDINYQDLKTGSHLDQVMEKRLQAAGIKKAWT